ncbi:MAG: alpha/beta hydrolase-fold protein, partial [Planctomycetota bacterium]
MTHRRTLLALLLLALSPCALALDFFRPGKVVVHYYHCELDDTDQPYSAWVPRDYDPKKKWPLVVQLHGLGGNYRMGGVRREIEDCVVVNPDGRGATDYKLWGMLDVLHVLEDAKRRYNIDEDRVYLYGVSMGGSGSWQIGVHYPDRFAALGPVCGNADHRVWEKLWGWGEKDPTWMSPKKRWVE